MKYVTYKGAIYSKANERIRELRAKNRPYSLTTEEEQLQIDNFLYWKVKATLTMLDTTETFTGCAMRRYEKDNPFGSYPLEWAETVATARAIGKMGIGIDYWYACLEELAELDRAEVKDREGDVPAVTLTDDKVEKELPVQTFTVNDMKASLEQEVKPVTIEVETDKSLSRAEVLAAKLKAKEQEKLEKKKGKIVRLPVEPEPEVVLPRFKPDQYDNILQSIESPDAMPEYDPIFGNAFNEEPDTSQEPKESDDLEIIDIN